MSAELKNIVTTALAAAASVAATGNGAAFDLRDYDGDLRLVLSSAAGTGTNPTLDVKVQESDDGTTGWGDAGVAFAQVTNAASLQTLAVDANKFKRFIRVVDTLGGTSSPTFARAVMLTGKRRV